MTWPMATLDTGARARVIAAAIPSAALVEAAIDAPFEEVWPWLSDLERSVPEFDPTVADLKVVSKDGPRWRVRASAPYVRVKLPFDVRIEEGFCLMRAKWRLFAVVMTATPLPRRAHPGDARGGRAAAVHPVDAPAPTPLRA